MGTLIACLITALLLLLMLGATLALGELLSLSLRALYTLADKDNTEHPRSAK